MQSMQSQYASDEGRRLTHVGSGVKLAKSLGEMHKPGKQKRDPPRVDMP